MKDLIPSGRFAELNSISKKALRIYHDMGLIEPVSVGENGYNYYTLDQCSRIDMIGQLQSLGVTLSDIKGLADNGSRGLAKMLAARVEALDEEILGLVIARECATQMLANCRLCHQSPVYDEPIVEYLPSRRTIEFPLFNPGALVVHNDVEQFLDEWELELRLVKRHMSEKGIPASLFHHVGCRIARDDLEARRYNLLGSFIFVDDDRIAERYATSSFPSGMYLAMYKRSYTEIRDDRLVSAEVVGLDALLDYAQANGLVVAGDYYGQIVAETPAFHYEGREMLFKLTIPVRSA